MLCRCAVAAALCSPLLRSAIVAVATGCVAGLVAWSAAREVPVVVTPTSPSVPRGVYLVLQDAAWEKGAVVLFAPPADVRMQLEALTGKASERLWAKVVAGVGGDVVCASTVGITVNGIRLQAVDAPAAGRPPLRGCEVVGTDRIYLVGLHPRSYDSRYWGSIDTLTVRATLRRLEWLSWF